MKKKNSSEDSSKDQTISLGIEKIINLPIPRGGGCGTGCTITNNNIP